jgi:hypothetical protein
MEILLTYFLDIPWFVVIWLMLDKSFFVHPDLNAIESIIYCPQRILWHTHCLGRCIHFNSVRLPKHSTLNSVIRAITTPLLQLILGIIVKCSLGLNREELASNATQWTLIRRYINSWLLSQHILSNAFEIIRTHYEMISVGFSTMLVKPICLPSHPGCLPCYGHEDRSSQIWGIHCLDPELLEIGDDVVFGSRSELFTTDAIGTGKILIEAGGK